MTEFRAADVQGLRASGRCILPVLVDPALRAEFEDALGAIGQVECSKHRIDPGVREPIAAALAMGGDYRVSLFTKLKELAVLQDMTSAILARLRRDRVLANLGFLVPTLHATLKGDLPGETTFLFPWHQDYRLTRSHRAYRLWVPLRPVNAIDGSMEIAIGSHDDRFDYTGERQEYRHIPPAQIEGRYRTEVVDLPAGDGVLFDPRAVHRSVVGRGTRMRFVLILHIEDAAAFMNPLDPDDPLAQFVAVATEA